MIPAVGKSGAGMISISSATDISGLPRSARQPLIVSVNSKDEVYLGETRYELKELGDKLKAVHEEKPDQRVFIRGDKTINYGRMMEVMGVVIDSGFRQLGLLGEQGAQPAPPGTVTAPGTRPAPRR